MLQIFSTLPALQSCTNNGEHALRSPTQRTQISKVSPGILRLSSESGERPTEMRQIIINNLAYILQEKNYRYENPLHENVL